VPEMSLYASNRAIGIKKAGAIKTAFNCLSK
jgi:hypothetical protein